MAFCPECGKPVTPDEAACSACGKQLRSVEKKPRSGRFNGTMMMTAPEVKEELKREPPANINAQRPLQPTEQPEQAEPAVAAAAGMTSPRLGPPVAATRSSIPVSGKQASNPAPAQMKATMIGAGVAPKPVAQRPEQKHATMLGAALAPTTPRSKPPGSISSAPQAKAPSVAPSARSSDAAQTKPAVQQKPSSFAPRAKSGAPPSSIAPAPAKQPMANSERPPVVRQTSLHVSTNPSVRAVQSVPVSPAPEGSMPARPAPAPEPKPDAPPVLHDAKTVPSPIPPRGHTPRAPNPARMVQAIPEVDATVVDPSELPNGVQTLPRDYVPSDPMKSQPPASMRAPRLREYPFAPENPEVEGDGNYVMLYWAVCVAVVAAVCALAFRLF